jgi:hypothetical protein
MRSRGQGGGGVMAMWMWVWASLAGAACGTEARPFGGGGFNGGGGANQGTGGNGNGGAPGSGGAQGGRAGGAASGGRAGGNTAGRGSGGEGAVGGSGGSAGAGGPCPTAMPMTSACAPEGLICEYGNDPRPGCRPRAACNTGRWVLTQPTCAAVPPSVGGCPAARVTAQGRACAPNAAICSYNGLNCLCASCPPDGPVGCIPNPATLAWYCDVPNIDPACPAATPRLGASCPTEGKQCDYMCGAEGSRLCRVGVWTAVDGIGCPRSSRNLKRDIHYLEPGEIEKLAAQITRLRLATWQYKDPALSNRRHLGFIIEDQPDIAAVDKARGIVDLYGYASMLAAALKAQELQIESLRRQVDALRAATTRPRSR